ncbi:hypothetical protein DUNSADRAFT_9955 [Dunaliella salina]|uniref:Fructose-bisphosphatase n=1 Tax=Dunaliella salina TaxID=3046 RepID=A0ABQ7GGF6_DUNSA|nr:hypothetical protein DUNSADRAFT_9955 [Dunaliella salina]|eukprot:KAF5833684.1 hypothetical protein DUNSADRAFT_9955 [Dunaliella salina]
MSALLGMKSTSQGLLPGRGGLLGGKASPPVLAGQKRSVRSVRPVRVASEGVGPDYSAVQRNLALEIVRVTEAAALASGRWLGRGDKEAADQAAVDMMRSVLNGVRMDGVVVIGEGEKDEAPMLYCGERIGHPSLHPKIDIAVDPLDGTTLTAQGRPGAMSIIAMAERGALFDPGPCVPDFVSATSLEMCLKDPCPANSSTCTLGVKLCYMHTQCQVVLRAHSLSHVLHARLSSSCHTAGEWAPTVIEPGSLPLHLCAHQPTAPSHLLCINRPAVAKAGGPVDLMLGVGGTPEGVIAAAALKCMGGHFQGRLYTRNDDERTRAIQQGYDLGKIYDQNDLVKGDDVFFAATGVSDGDLLQGVRYYSGGASTSSLVMRARSGTVRFIQTYHRWGKPGITNTPGADMAYSVALGFAKREREMKQATPVQQP